ncbi:Ubiquitin-conjugating enzyme E2 [Wickerhamomyces ciferrii]|uniref:Ubiquitin-conjugating enzyme E2 6 n=1 Tax=Wickerhamomyces ciferrii (strain ATCC 14091 / BCRC 22168 / CBS 111 / JCM 3599 / NBRC 0793 / NRRL Y-1031 F-60-10) TaxID=1206466 RepID=K0KBH9_WICCF|nr:Ubiquitin-conjugating enzyme E2 [Wickerhamomyces ciferrii]CCH42380.1 Ubiquitin-conjugating enzyme E2 [Wickerhamomyces ciferrii]
MATVAAQKRLTKEYKNLKAEPIDLVFAKPSESNILQWHYIITGPPDTPFQGGEYYGLLTFPPQYPFKPPAIKMITPNGRFQPNTRLCLSISDYHPETWNPAWSVGTILTGLTSFMTSQEVASGCVKTSESAKITYSKNSAKFNRSNENFLREFKEYFAEKEEREDYEERIRERELKAKKDREEAEKRALANGIATNGTNTHLKRNLSTTSNVSETSKRAMTIDLDTKVDSPDSFNFNEVDEVDELDDNDFLSDEDGVVVLDESDQEDELDGEPDVVVVEKGTQKKKSKSNPTDPIVID